MADYYPLLAKAVSGLKNSTSEARHSIYERARKALLGQLRNMQPPAPESAIERESKALDEAIARLEKEFSSVVLAGPVPASAPALEKPAQPAPPPPSPPAPPSGGLAEEESRESGATAREALRPAAPRPETGEGGGLRRLAIVVGVFALVSALVGFAAWKLRDRPEDLAKLAPAPEAASDQKSGGKIDERIGSDSNTSPRPAAPAGGGQALPIAYRAAVLMQAPSEPGGVKTFLGTAVWRREASNSGPNQQLATAIKVDVDVPDAKLKMSLTIEKNYETALSASHTLTIRFVLGADSPVGVVNTVNMPEMRRDDAPKGAALQGLEVDIAPNVFLVGLAATAEAQNVELLKGPNWIDIPLSLASGRIAKVTFEKGTAGERLVSDVLAEWKGQ